MRYLAIDLGDKRTGLALGDSETRLATPVEVLHIPVTEREGQALLDALTRAIGEHLGERSAGELVIGLPFNMDGSEGSRAKVVRAFASRLATATKRTVHFQDERLTSADADWQMAQSGLTHKQKKERRDAIAAAAILRDFLESQPR